MIYVQWPVAVSRSWKRGPMSRFGRPYKIRASLENGVVMTVAMRDVIVD